VKKLAIFVLVLAASGPAYAQLANPLASGAGLQYVTINASVTRAAAKKPEDNDPFQPTPEVRPFAQLVGGFAMSTSRLCSVLVGHDPPTDAATRFNSWSTPCAHAPSVLRYSWAQSASSCGTLTAVRRRRLLGDTANTDSEPWNAGRLGRRVTLLGFTAWHGQDGAQTPSLTPTAQGSSGHIFWVIPAFKVEALRNIRPLTPGEKFNEWALGAYDPLGLAGKATEAALEHSRTDGFCGYGSGWGGYGKCYGSALIDGNVSSFLGDFVFPTLMHQDPRYFRLEEGSVGARVVYALARVFITRTDTGGASLDSSALLGTAIAGANSNLYYPPQDRGFGLTMSRIGWDLGSTAIFNLQAEFWPDIHGIIRRMFRRSGDPGDPP
jgi:hypothetical protein